MLEQTKALWFQAVSEARANPSKEQVLRAYAAQYTVMENANALATQGDPHLRRPGDAEDRCRSSASIATAAAAR